MNESQDSPKPTAGSVQNVQNEDLISRKAAIDAFEDTTFTKNEILRRLLELPSAQPEPLVKESRTLVKDLVKEPCEDAVSREAVTDVIRHSDIFSTWYEMDDTDDIVAEVIDEARKQLVDDVNELPSVTPKCPECDDAVSREAAIDAALSAFSRGLLASPDIRKLPSVTPKPHWIPVSERLPENLEEVNVTWVNRDPEPYYDFIKDKPATASAVYYKGEWYWYSSVCGDILAEYGKNDTDKVDDAIEIIAWMSLPEPYRAERRTDD